MRYDRFSYRILCEDQKQYNFVVGFLAEKGARIDRIRRAIPFAEGNKGDACKYVFDNFNDQCTKIRQRAAHTKSILIVLCDADPSRQKKDKSPLSEDLSVKVFNAAYNQLHATVTSDDPIFLLVASRNIETWLYFLQNPQDSEAVREIPERKNPDKLTVGEATAFGKKLAKDLSRLSSNHFIPVSLKRSVENADRRKALLKQKWPDAF